MADLTRISISDKLSIFTCGNNITESKSESKTNVCMVYLLDNSGSMGNMTKECATAFGQVYDFTKTANINMLPGMLILFADDAKVHTTNIRSVSDMKINSFPQQGSTNITAGVECSLNNIILHHKGSPTDTHYILVYLSDGGHNIGPLLTTAHLNKFRTTIQSKQIKLSVIVAGIINQDTGLGMMIKTQLETVDMPYLESIYYARSTGDLKPVLQNIQEGFLRSLDNYTIYKLRLDGGIFISDMTNLASCMLSGNQTNYYAVKHIGNKPLHMYLDEKLVADVPTRQLRYDDITAVIDSISPKLAQKNITSGASSIKEQIKLLEELIDSGEIFLEKVLKQLKSETKEVVVEDIGKVKIKPSDRLQMIKKMNTSTLSFKTERNKLKALLATIENNSAKQAEYLTGINKKYAAKALARSSTAEVSLKQIYDDIVKIGNSLSTLPTDAKESEMSILSLSTPIEQCTEWMTVKEKKLDEFEDEYSFLVFCGFIGYPVKFEHNNAVQMDPFQTRCLILEPYLADTPSIMLANKMNYNGLHSPMDQTISLTDLLILVQPTCPQHHLLVMRSLPYKLLCSVTLCRDLNMYHSQMTFSMYAHAFMKAVNLYFKSSTVAYLRLAVHILYSAYKLGINNQTLFKHWMEEFGKLTQSEDDKCNHPVQLLLLLGLNKIENKAENYNTPLINMLNEALSRIMKIKLASANADGKKLAQKLLNITAETSPKPDMNDLMKPEPSNEDVRNSCINIDATETNNEVLKLYHISQASVDEFVDHALRSYFRTFQFCLELQTYIGDRTWVELAATIEEKGFDEIAGAIKAKLVPYNNVDLYSYLNVDEKKMDFVSMNMFLQASLYTSSGDRADILDHNVFELSTFRKMSVDLMMDFYSNGCKVKREEYLKIVGDVTYGDALSASDAQFDMMLGIHTHGLSKQKFWGLLRATKGSANKKDMFLKKSNQTVRLCFGK
jgi:hypothetical protein